MAAEVVAGTVVASFGHTPLVRLDSGEEVTAKLRNRRLQAVCGDRVEVRTGSQAILDSVAPRSNVFARASAHRTKVLAANITQVAILVACEPPFSDELLCRFLVGAERAGVPALIVLNKVDLVALRDQALATLVPFRGLGYPLLELCAKEDIEPLRRYLHRHRTLFVGQSGMGKSTLVKTLVPEAEVRIREISRYLGTGKQTTTAARLYPIDALSTIVDTPGVSEFGLSGFGDQAIAAGFREFTSLAESCRFSDCTHIDEPDCAVESAVRDGRVHPRRLTLYRAMMTREGSPGGGAKPHGGGPASQGQRRRPR